MAFPATPLDVIVEMAIGADPDANPSTWSWTDITDYVLARDDIRITRGRQDRFATTAPAALELTLNNVNGRFVVRNPAGAYYPNLRRNVPIRVSVDPGSGPVPRFTGFADNLPLANDTSGNDAHVTLKASGLLKRLSRPAAQILSSPRRWIPSSSPLVYWPLEEGPTAGYGAPDVGTGRLVPWTGKHPSGAVATFARWGTGNLGPWLPPVFAFPGATDLNILVGRVDMGGSPTQWTVAFMYAGGTGSQQLTLDINPGYLDGSTAWPQLILDPAALLLQVTFNGEPATDSSVPGLFDGIGHSVRITGTQSGGNVSWTVYIDGVSAQTHTTSGAMTLPPVFAVALVSAASGGASLGHLAVWSSPTPSNTVLAKACLGWPDEPAGWRLERLCLDEFNIPFASVGGGDFLTQHVRLGDTQPMGAQPYAAFLPIAREAEDVDGGILAEATTGELEYLNGRDRYNRAVDLALDYDLGHVAPPFEPADDDSAIVNDVTASRAGGGSDVGRYVDEDHVAAEGRYDEGITLNVVDEDDLQNQASWRVHQGTVPELRFPRLTLNLARNTGLIDDWLACNLSSRVTVDNPPPELPPELIDQHIVGYTETLGQFKWQVEANLAPASSYTVGIWEDTVLGRADTDGSVTTASFTAGTNMSLTVAVTAGNAWVTTAGNPSEFPFDIQTGGAILTVTGIDAVLNSNPFFESAATPWTATGGTFVRSTAQFHQGVASGLLTPDGVTAVPEVRSENVDGVEAGQTYKVSAWVRCAVARSVNVNMVWRDAAGTFLSSAGALSFAVAATTWTQIELIATAPASTAQAQISISMGSTPLASHLLHMDEAELSPVPTILNSNPFFETNANGWTAAGGTFVRSTAQFHQGAASGLLTPNGVASAAEAFSDLVAVVPGVSYTASSWVRCAVARNVQVAIYWYTAGSVFISSQITTLAVAATTWTLIEATAAAPATATQARIDHILTSTPLASHLLHVDEARLFPTGGQTFTVTAPAVNGVARTVPAGTDVRLAHPMIAGL